jgi:ribosomal protein S18 acetylase RimI-like enzyme
MEPKVNIREMRKADIRQAAEVLGRAYATNPAFLAIFRDKPMILRRLQTTFEGILKYIPYKSFMVELDGRIVGGMLVVKSPGCQAMSLKASLRVMPYILRAAGGLGPLVRRMKMAGASKRHDPKQPHWHLQFIGIAPEFQHKGVGSHCMTFYCDLVDRDGMDAYHGTDDPENVSFYERFGFKVVGEETVIGVRKWYMLRPAKFGK